MLIAITTEGKLGLGILAGLFIAFAILSAFYFPRRNPDFPGERVGLFAFIALILFVGTLAGVIFFAREEEEPGGEAVATQPGETGETGTEQGATTAAPEEPAGDAAAGKQVFAQAGCGGCHTLEAAASSGQVGPNLDDAKPPHDLVIERVTNGAPPMPSFKGQLSDKQIQDVAAFVVQSTSG